MIATHDARPSPKPNARVALLAGLLGFLIVGRLCHSGILWTDGDYHLAAAMQWQDGKALYRDLWYDKPPLTAVLFRAFGLPTGWALSLLEALVAWSACWFAYLTARKLGGPRAAVIAACLLAFFLTFYIPTAVIPIAPDLLMLVPHVAAIYCMFAGKPGWAGFCAALAFWTNAKGIFVLIACLAIAPLSALPLLLGFLAPCLCGAGLLVSAGAWNGYLDQVWRWSLLYARNSPVSSPWGNALVRTLNWSGFHAALILGAAAYLRKRSSPRWLALILWMAISFAGVAQGMRFLPRYYFQLLAPLTVIAALGFASLPKRHCLTIAAVIALLIPVIRFGPAYATLALDNFSHRPHHWTDLALDQDDQALAAILRPRAAKTSSLFVWGYRPGLYVYTRLDAPTLFWDSQPLTGVPADRHLGSSTSIAPQWSLQNRQRFAQSRPDFVVDSLSMSNPALAIDRYPGLRAWFRQYHACAHTPLSKIYCVQ